MRGILYAVVEAAVLLVAASGVGFFTGRLTARRATEVVIGEPEDASIAELYQAAKQRFAEGGKAAEEEAASVVASAEINSEERLAEIRSAEEAVALADAELAVIVEQLREKQSQRDGAESAMERASAVFQDRASMVEQTRVALAATRERMSDLWGADRQVAEVKAAALESEVVQGERRLEEARESLESATAEFNAAASAGDEIQRLKDDRTAAELRVERARARVSDARNRLQSIEVVRLQAAAARAELLEVSNERSQLDQSLDQHRRELAESIRVRAENSAALAKMKLELGATEAALADLATQRTDAEASLAEVRAGLQQATDEHEALESARRELDDAEKIKIDVDSAIAAAHKELDGLLLEIEAASTTRMSAVTARDQAVAATEASERALVEVKDRIVREQARAEDVYARLSEHESAAEAARLRAEQATRDLAEAEAARRDVTSRVANISEELERLGREREAADHDRQAAIAERDTARRATEAAKQARMVAEEAARAEEMHLEAARRETAKLAEAADHVLDDTLDQLQRKLNALRNKTED